MTSLLRQKTNSGVISCANRDLYDHVVFGGSATDRMTKSDATTRSSVQLSNFVLGNTDVQYQGSAGSSSMNYYYDPVSVRSPVRTAINRPRL